MQTRRTIRTAATARRRPAKRKKERKQTTPKGVSRCKPSEEFRLEILLSGEADEPPPRTRAPSRTSQRTRPSPRCWTPPPGACPRPLNIDSGSAVLPPVHRSTSRPSPAPQPSRPAHRTRSWSPAVATSGRCASRSAPIAPRRARARAPRPPPALRAAGRTLPLARRPRAARFVSNDGRRVEARRRLASAV